MKTLLLSALVVGGCVAPNESEATQETSPVGVTPTLLSRGTLAEAFKVESEGAVPIEITTKGALDIITRRHDYAVNGSTGWHQHPGPVIITVTVGTVTFYEADDPTCTPKVVGPGQAYVDSGHGHIGRNESGAPAVDVTVITAPVGLPFRSEIAAPGNCPF